MNKEPYSNQGLDIEKKKTHTKMKEKKEKQEKKKIDEPIKLVRMSIELDVSSMCCICVNLCQTHAIFDAALLMNA